MKTFGVMRLQDELSRWGALGEKPVFWIRDDDAIKITRPLEQLQLIAARHDTTIGLAVIPALLESDLATFLRFERNNFYPMCHGWKHINFGEDGNPNEFGTSRPFRSAFIDATSALQTFSLPTSLPFSFRRSISCARKLQQCFRYRFCRPLERPPVQSSAVSRA